MNLSIVGHFAVGQEFNDGQTVKTRNLYNKLVEIYGQDEVDIVDTYNYKKNPLKLLKNCVNAIKNSNNVIILPAKNGVKVFVPLFVRLNKKYNKKLIYAVVGGWLPDVLENNKKLLGSACKLNQVLVETEGMKKRLNDLGMNNVDILLNFKNISVLQEKDLPTLNSEVFKVCTFSRVIKEKGIENAINAVNIVNKKLGKTAFKLDIFGPVGNEYKEDFDKVLNSCNKEWVEYKGVIPSSESVGILKEYNLLLFPTYYFGEGLAGTVIDAYSAGVPVIASDWKYNSEVVKNGITGQIFETKNDKEFAEILEKYYLGEIDIQTIRKNCLEEAKKYTPDIAILGITKYIK